MKTEMYRINYLNTNGRWNQNSNNGGLILSEWNLIKIQTYDEIAMKFDKAEGMRMPDEVRFDQGFLILYYK